MDEANFETLCCFNCLPNDEFIDWSKLKALAYNRINVTEKLKNCFGKSRKHDGKRRKCWLKAFSPFPIMFSKGLLSGSLKVRIVW